MKHYFFILIFCAVFSISSYAENMNVLNNSEPQSNLNNILQKLQKNTVLRSQFKQARYLKILSKPIISEGQLNYFSGKGIIWKIQTPIKSTIIISQNKITEINPDGQLTSRVNLGSIYTLLDALFNGNDKTLKQNFDISYNISTQQWILKLTPTSAPLNKIFKTIEIQGQQQITRITLIDANSDSTVISLHSTDTKPLAISATEEAYFAL